MAIYAGCRNLMEGQNDIDKSGALMLSPMGVI